MSKRRILLVDDEFHITEIVKLLLERAGGFTVKTINKSSNALDVARSFKPDLVLMDLMMPGLTGDHLVSEMRRDAGLQNVRVLMFTSAATRDDIVTRGGHIGGVPFLPKPSPPQTILEKIQQTLTC